MCSTQQVLASVYAHSKYSKFSRKGKLFTARSLQFLCKGASISLQSRFRIFAMDAVDGPSAYGSASAESPARPTEDTVRALTDESPSQGKSKSRCMGHSSSSSRRRSSMRRLSRAYLSISLAEEDSDSDFFSPLSSEAFDSMPPSPRRVVKCFRLSDSDSDFGEDDGGSLEDMFRFQLSDLNKGQGLDMVADAVDSIENLFSFDLDRVADALRRCVDKQELEHIIEMSMAENLESMTSEVALCEVSPLMAGDLSGRMTPPSPSITSGDLAGRMTPPTTAVAGRAPPKMEGLTDRLAEVLSPSRRRRSSVVQMRRLSVAVREVCVAHRQSLAKAATLEL